MSVTACTNPGYITTLSIGGTNYNVTAYIQENDGSKRYLLATCNQQSFEKIKNLVSGLLNAHDARRTSLNEAPYPLTILDERGLGKPDNSFVSHDFLIQSVSQPVADQMATALTSFGHPMQASAVKAQDVWSTVEGLIRGEIGSASAPATPAAATPPAANPPATPATPAAPSSSSVPATTSATPPATPSAPANNPTSAPIPSPPQRLVRATEMNLRGINLEQPNWYDQIPDRTKLRVLTDIVEYRAPQGGVYGKIWKHFESKNKNILGLIQKEQKRLSLLCKARSSSIPAPIQNEAETLIEAFHRNANNDHAHKEKIVEFMRKEFACKEQLFQYIREQAIAQGVVIEDWDQKWAEFHYIENTYLFVQALIRWLDNN